MNALIVILLLNALPPVLLSLGVAGLVAERQARRGRILPTAGMARYDAVFSAAWYTLIVARAVSVWYVLSHTEKFGFLEFLFVPELFIYPRVAPNTTLYITPEAQTNQTLLLIGLDVLIAWLSAHPIAASARRHRAHAARLGFGLILTGIFVASYFPANGFAVGFFCFAYPLLGWLAERRLGRSLPKGVIFAGAASVSLAAGYVFWLWITTRSMN